MMEEEKQSEIQEMKLENSISCGMLPVPVEKNDRSQSVANI